jgi:hypothetical protein
MYKYKHNRMLHHQNKPEISHLKNFCLYYLVLYFCNVIPLHYNYTTFYQQNFKINYLPFLSN